MMKTAWKIEKNRSPLRRIGAAALSLFLAAGLLCGAALAEGTEDPVVVRVDDLLFRKSQVQPALESEIDLLEALDGVWMTEEEKAERRDAAVARFVSAGLIQVKLREAGKNDFSAEEEETLKESARNQYEQLWQGLWQRAQESEEKFTEEQITEFMEDAGYTVEALYEEMKATERRYRAVELFCPGLIITEEMIQEYYRTNFLEPDQERYAQDLDLYEEEVLAKGNESFYVPDGYRAIQQILLAYPGEVDRALKKERARLNLAGRALAARMQELASAAVAAEKWEDLTEAKGAYGEAEAEMTAARTAYDEKRKALAEPLVAPQVQEIRAEWEKGTDISSLIRKYSTDTGDKNLAGGGYPVHPDSKNWSPEFLAAALALEKPGDLSEPVYTDLGIHLLYYASDIPGGAHELTESERETLVSSATWYYQGLELEKLIERWKTEHEIETHPELLDEE